MIAVNRIYTADALGQIVLIVSISCDLNWLKLIRCQVIAHTLSGEVGFNPGKRFILKAETVTTNSSFSDYLQSKSGDLI